MATVGKQALGPEEQRLCADARRAENWKRWGPYLSARQWGTVREDYSPDGSCWTYFPHDHARSRAYRWGEDGLLGITDRECRLCFALALWNGRDPFLKERLFGLTNPEGNHGEDVKECYYYLDSTPTHSYLKALYKYPQAEFPYALLVTENGRRSSRDPEFELTDTGVFADGRYFDVFAEYAKASPNDIVIRITVANRGPAEAILHVLPTLWFRNTWAWGCKHEGCWAKPEITAVDAGTLRAWHETLGTFLWHAGPGPDGQRPPLLLADNETNQARLFGVPNVAPYVKDAFHEYVVGGRGEALRPAGPATKTAAHYVLKLAAGGEQVLKLRLVAEPEARPAPLGETFDATFAQRGAEAEGFYRAHPPELLSDEDRGICHQAYAGLLWNKQFYHYVMKDWLEGDPDMPPPPASRRSGRNADWGHLFNRDVISMPDNWEYPWYAAWDLAFHMVALARIDPEFAKQQLILFLREWYMHPSGQLPAYEFALSDVNPPVHAWACWRVYKMTAARGQRDHLFLARVFHKLMLNFTWWVNRKDVAGHHIFAGGFLGLDNVGVFDRSQPLPQGGCLEQADGTAWMAFYAVTLLAMALELASTEPEYEDVASKFFEHFVAIADAMNCLGGTGLWDEEDGFYYDHMQIGERDIPLRVRSLVGLIPLLAADNIEDEAIARLPGFRKRMQWFLDNRRDLARQIAYMEQPAAPGHAHRLLAIPSRERLERVLQRVLAEDEFLSPHGIRSLSKYHAEHPFVLNLDGQSHCVAYEPGESVTRLFGGNSNWRGPIWVPMNYLIIEALERYHHFYGDTLTVEFPSGSGRRLNLNQVAGELYARVAALFRRGADGRRPCHCSCEHYTDPHWRDLLLFHEYFHGDTGQGLGASHQTGWTALAALCIQNAVRAAVDARGLLLDKGR